MKQGSLLWNNSAISDREHNPLQVLLNSAKWRAKQKGIPFKIKLHDLRIPNVCPYLKTPFIRNTMYAMSLDQVNPGKGYIKGNVEIISRKANAMKNNASVQELLEFAYTILERH